MPIFTDHEFELDGDDFYLSGASADYDYSLSYCDGDDYRGWEVGSIELHRIRLGGIYLTRSQAVEATNAAYICRLEEMAAERILQDVFNGDLLAAE